MAQIVSSSSFQTSPKKKKKKTRGSKKGWFFGHWILEAFHSFPQHLQTYHEFQKTKKSSGTLYPAAVEELRSQAFAHHVAVPRNGSVDAIKKRENPLEFLCVYRILFNDSLGGRA
jgi:hypothetical protein